ncbi:uncharacterized protein LOC127241436 [Andrographis paniculata]|uniref:uncharacterized protein LOC127241436 n=1 Tax=Andrographis paniculata TaxID=175694 RepID=UPI0021E87495|nr:uncharacterized protein LOC127241436 [Andrographis paniculata]
MPSSVQPPCEQDQIKACLLKLQAVFRESHFDKKFFRLISEKGSDATGDGIPQNRVAFQVGVSAACCRTHCVQRKRVVLCTNAKGVDRIYGCFKVTIYILYVIARRIDCKR